MSYVSNTELLGLFNQHRTSLSDPVALERLLIDRVGFEYGWRGMRKCGLRIKQNPTEFSEWLIWCATRQVSSVLEIGTYFGGTAFTLDAYLRVTLGSHYRGITTIDRKKNIWRLDEYAPRNPGFEFIEADSRTWVPDRNYGLVFIDGQHDYASVRSDWNRFHSAAPIVCLHDIAIPDDGRRFGVHRLWQEIKTPDAVEIVDRSAALTCGIGIIEQ